MAKGDPILEVSHLVKHFPIKEGLLIDREVARVQAVDDVSLTLREGETLGLVGESGCGKSTLCRTILQLLQPTSGSVKFEGNELVGLSRKQLHAAAPGDADDLPGPLCVAQPPQAGGADRRRPPAAARARLRAAAPPPGPGTAGAGGPLCRALQPLPARVLGRPAPEDRDRSRARPRPRLIIADEPVSALDVSIQAQIINLLDDLQDEFGLSYIFVAHDLGVVRHVSDRIAVMYLGKIVERSPGSVLYDRPIHPYSVALLSAVPIPDPNANRERQPLVLEGDVPSPIDPPAGCRFHTRCPWATEVCSEAEPPLVDYGSGEAAACHHPQNVDAMAITKAEVAPDSPNTASDRLPGSAEEPAASTAR